MSNLVIDPKKFYSLREMLPFVPWIKSLSTLRRWVLSDRKTNNYLKAQIIGEGVGKRYLILGENIINYLAQADDQGLNQIPKEGGDINE